MELRELKLKDGEQIKIIGCDNVEMFITRYGPTLNIEGPLNRRKAKASVSNDGIQLHIGLSD